MADAILAPHPKDAIVDDELLMEVVDLLTGWAAIDWDQYTICIVNGCMVRSRVLDAGGMCPRELWDERHERIAAIPEWLLRR